MTTFYAAAKYNVGDTPEAQWRQLSDLLMVSVELVRLARETGRDIDDVTRVFEEATDTAVDEWESADDAD